MRGRIKRTFLGWVNSTEAVFEDARTAHLSDTIKKNLNLVSVKEMIPKRILTCFLFFSQQKRLCRVNFFTYYCANQSVYHIY